MTEFVAQYVDYLPWVVLLLILASGVGIPINEDLVLIPAGIIIGEQALGPGIWVPTLIFGWFGVATADAMWFFICGHFGTRLLHRRFFRRLVHPRRMLQVKHQIDQRGIWVIVAARFIPGARMPAITVAGLMHLRAWRFLLVTYTCVMITAPMQLAAGVLIGRGLASSSTFGAVQWIIAGVVLVVGVSVVAVIFARSHESGNAPPRARAAWLRRYRHRRGP